MPHMLRRRQFPVRLAYAMTINKAQGQTLNRVGIYLPHPVFDHGQLYVAFSRAKSIDAVRVYVQGYDPDGRPHSRHSSNHTKNIVFQEVLHDELETADRSVVLQTDPGRFVALMAPTAAARPQAEHIRKTPTPPFHASENYGRGGIDHFENPPPHVSCYANVIVHCLLQIDEFTYYTGTDDTHLMEVFQRARDEGTCVAIRRHIGGIFATDQQQDCQEFLCAILDRLDDEFRAHFHYELHRLKRCRTCGHVQQLPLTEQPFPEMLQLTLPLNTKTSFRQMFAWTPSSGLDFCDHCHAQVEYGYTFARISTYLIVVLPRSMEDGTKNETVFEEFNPDRCEFGGQHFRTIAIVRHLGARTTSGHYICNVRGFNQKWVECNDSSLQWLRSCDTSLKDAYILIMRALRPTT